MDYKDKFPFLEQELQNFLKSGLETGGEYCDLFFEYRTSSSISLEDNIIKNAGLGIIQGVGARVVKGEQVGYAYTDELSPDKIKDAVKTASHIASSSAKPHNINVNRRNIHNLYPINVLSTNAGFEDKIAILRRTNETALKHSDCIKKVRIGFSDEVKYILVVNTEGVLMYDVRPMVLLRVNCIAEKYNNRQSGSYSSGARMGLEYFDKHSPEDTANIAAGLAVLNLSADDAPTGEMEVVLGAGDSGVLLHEAVGHGLEADFNRKGLSFYSNKVGQKVASNLCTVVDDGTIDFSRGSINMDDEGNITGQTVLIEDGILVGYLHDRISADIMKTKPTGNGRRQSYQFPPMPRMTNTYLKAGQYDAEEIISSVKKGIYAKRFGGGQVDITNGDFVFGVEESYLIENGKILKPLKNVTLIGNGPDVMDKVVMVGNDLELAKGGWSCGKGGQKVPVAQGVPTLKISSMTVGGTSVQF